MVTDKLKELEAAKARLEELQRAVDNQVRKELAALPGKYGFDSVADFVRAVQDAAGARGRRGPGRRPGRPAGAGSGGGRAASGGSGGGRRRGGRRRRAVIDDAVRAEVKKLAEGGKTGAEIAKAVGISLPSVQNVKKALGLVKARK